MSRLDELPPDQRAALSLLLRQRKSYAELASVLGIPPRAVHDRAHAALAVLAPRQARELTQERREEIGEYLLAQQAGVAERLATRTYLAGSPAAQAWARALVSELRPLASAGLPEIPQAGTAQPGASTGAPVAGPSTPRAQGTSGIPTPASGMLPSSRLGGALILAAILAAIVVAVVLLSGGGSSHTKSTAASPPASESTSSATSSASAPNTASTASTPSAATPSVKQHLTLRPTEVNSKSIAMVDVIAEGRKRAFYIEAQGLQPSTGFFYAVWLYNSPNSFLPLSKSPPVGSNRHLAGGALLPSNAGNYHEMLLTRETSERPKSPGQIVLRGHFSLGG
jgi:sigma-70-like protein